MHGCLPASCTTPATLALMTAVGPPDCATKRLPINSGILRSKTRNKSVPTAQSSVKEDFPNPPSRAPSSSFVVVLQLQTLNSPQFVLETGSPLVLENFIPLVASVSPGPCRPSEYRTRDFSNGRAFRAHI